jgi:hypothetical protein
VLQSAEEQSADAAKVAAELESNCYDEQRRHLMEGSLSKLDCKLNTLENCLKGAENICGTFESIVSRPVSLQAKRVVYIVHKEPIACFTESQYQSDRHFLNFI